LGLVLGANAAQAANLWTDGHGDLGLAYDAGSLEWHVHLHTGTVVNGTPLPGDAEFAPGDVVVFVPGSSVFSRPPGSDWDFLGTGSGQTVWTLPQFEVPGMPWPGFATEELNPLNWQGDLAISLLAVDGPGEFSLWTDPFGGSPQVVFATSDGIGANDTFQLAAGRHTHYAFGFTAEGIYEVTLRAQGTHLADGPAEDIATFTFGVNQAPVPEPGSLFVLAGLCGLGGVLAARRWAQR
jgi:surface-anchored protein